MYRRHQHPGGWVRRPECSWSADSFPLEQRTFCHLGPWRTSGLSAPQGGTEEFPQELQDSHPFGKQTGPPYTSNEKVPVLWAAGQGRLPVAVGEARWQSGLGAVGAHTFLGPGDRPPPCRPQVPLRLVQAWEPRFFSQVWYQALTRPRGLRADQEPPACQLRCVAVSRQPPSLVSAGRFRALTLEWARGPLLSPAPPPFPSLPASSSRVRFLSPLEHLQIRA